MALRFNTFRAKRYLRSKFVEGKYLLASEASDIELEILDVLRKVVMETTGNVALADAWKVEKLSSTQLLIKPGSAWFQGLPFDMRSGKDQLISGAVLSAGITPVGITMSDDATGLGKVILFNDGALSPTSLYKIVISAKEELLTEVEDPFLQNANLTESTAQKVRLKFQINIVPDSLQTESPVPYRDENSTSLVATNFPIAGAFSSPNLVNQIIVTPGAAVNGELITSQLITGSEKIDGRDIELTLRNDSAIGGGHPIPKAPTEQAAFENGRLIDSNGNKYHINAIFNDVVSTQVVIRIDKEPDQPNPEIVNTKPFTLIKRDVYATDGINGQPQGKLFWNIATVNWHSSNLIVHESSVVDLRTSVSSLKDYEVFINNKHGLRLTDGGNVSWTLATQMLNWSSALSLINPHGLTQTIALASVPLVEGGSLAYDLNIASGGAIQKGTLAINVTAFGANSTLSAVTLNQVLIGNIVVDSAGVVAEITAIDDITNVITTSPALTANGAGTIYYDSFGPAKVPLNKEKYILAVRKNNKAFIGGMELETGETSQVGDGASAQLLSFIGSTGDSDSSPNYPSNFYVIDSNSLVTAIGTLDTALNALAGVVAGINWKAPVANFAALPAVSNVNGDVRLVLDTRVAYTWHSASSSWRLVNNSGNGIKVIGGGTLTWTSPNLTFTADMYLEVKGLAYTDNTIAFSTQSPIALATSLDVAYVTPNQVTGGPSLVVTVGSLASVPANAIIIARRDGVDAIVGSSSTKLKSGQSTTLYAQTSDQTLSYMGSPDTADSTPAYSSDIRGTAAENLTARLGSLTNSMGDSQEDRSAFFRSDLPITWTGSQILFTSDIVLSILNTKSGTVKTATILLAGSPISLTDGQIAYITIDRTLASENLTPTIASSTPAQLQANKDIIILAYRKDVSGAGYLHLPLHKQVMNPGQTVRLGASGSGSGTGGAGDDINVLTFKASFKDDFSDIPSTSNSAVDITAGFTDSTAYSAAKALYQLSYDASKTVTGTGTAMTLSGTPSFTVKAGDILRVGSEARKITVVTTQTSYTLSSAFTVNPSASAATVSQAVYTKDINNLSVDGLAISTAFSTSIGQILVSYEDSSTVGDDIFDANTTPVIAYTASSDGTLYSDVKVRPTNLTDSEAMVNLPSSSTNLYLRFFSNKTTGSGTVNILGYRAFLHRDISYADGSLLNQAYAFTDGVGTEINCSAPTVVTGKTRLTVTFTYPIAVNVGTTNGSIKVYLNGQKIPRFVDATLTPDASYKEISTSTIELDGDYSALNYSLEVIQDVAVVDSSTNNAADIALIGDSRLQNQLMNGGFDLWQRGTSVTVANTISTYLADRWYVKNSLGTNGVITYSQVAGVQVGSKFGAKVQITTAPTAAQVNGTELYQVIENANTLALLDKIMSSRVYIKSFGLVNQVGIQFYYKTTEAKVDTALGSEALVTVNTSTFTLGQLLGQSINNLPTSAGVLGIRIRITGVSSGNLYDINNGFVVEQAMMNVGVSSLLFKRRGDSIREEIQDCQRYYEKSYNLNVNPGANDASGQLEQFARVARAANQAGTFGTYTTSFKVAKRIAPVCNYYGQTGTINAVYNGSSGLAISGITGFGAVGENTIFQIVLDTSSANTISLDNLIRWHFVADAEI